MGDVVKKYELRAAFEKWADCNNWFLERTNDGYYRSKEVECMWMGWEAASIHIAPDAVRYRWLREQELPTIMDCYHQNPQRFDSLIDGSIEVDSWSR